jgi:CheY-like chemotaxis protein
MNKKNDLALVRQPLGAAGQPLHGARRILPSMVADTLALAKKQPLQEARPLRIVMVNDEPIIHDVFGMLLRDWFKGVILQLYPNGFEAWQELSQTEPDLLITDDKMSGMSGDELCLRLLDKKVSFPIVVNSAWEETEKWVREFASRGLPVSFLPIPCDIVSFRKVVEAALRIRLD